MADLENDGSSVDCELEKKTDNPLHFETPAIITHECEYVGDDHVCQYSGFCEFQCIAEKKDEGKHEE